MVKVRNLLVTTMALFIAILLFSLSACDSGTDLPSTAETPASSAARLVFTAQPSGGISGAAFDTQPVVAAEDAAGNLVNDYSGTVELTITAGTGDSTAQLFGGTKILMQNSPVEFKHLYIDKAGEGYTLTASSGSLTPATSAPFSILPGEPAKLAFSVQPSDCTAGKPITPYPEVVVQDHYGNRVTDFEGSVSIHSTGYYDDYSDPAQPQGVIREFPVALSGATTVNLVNGVARFTDISSNKKVASRFTLTAVSNSLESATSSYFSISAGEPAKLEFTVQPAECKAGIPFDTQPKVAVEDIYGNVVNSAKVSVTVSITPGTGPDGAVLSGTSAVISDDWMGGLAEFTDLSIDLAGSGYTLSAAATGLQSAQSEAFDVSE